MLFGGEQGFIRAESEWANSEVGEGVEEIWERTVGLL
jgi:ribonuclease T2